MAAIDTTNYKNVESFFQQYNIDINGENAVEQIQALVDKNPDILVSIAELSADFLAVICNVPELEEPITDPLKEEDLEKLIALLQMSTDEKQLEQAKKRIEANKEKLKATYEKQMKNIQESIDAAKKAEKAGIFGRIFSWIGAAIAVAAAVAACIVTGGIAVGAVIGAVVAVGSLVLNETGAMDKIVKGMAESIMKTFGCDKNSANIASQVIIMAIMLALSASSIVASFSGVVISVGSTAANAAAKAAEIAAKAAEIASKVQNAIGIISLVLTAGNLGVQIAQTVTGYQASMSAVSSKEIEKLIAMIQQRMEEDEEELKAIMEALQNCVSGILSILESEMKAQNQIAENMGNMSI